MKLLFLTDNFPPEVNAPATRTYEHCKQWVQDGVDVTVITCAPNFPQGKVFDGYKNKFIQSETIDGIKVLRVWSYITSNSGFTKRILDYISYAYMAFWVGLFVKSDVIIGTSPQFFTAVSARLLGLFKRKPWILEVRDLWPESIAAVGAMKKDSLIYCVLSKVERQLYKSANVIIPVTNAFKQYIAQFTNEDKIHVITNGVDRSKFRPINKDRRLIEGLNLENKFIIGYIGTHGMAHGLNFVLNSIKDLPEDIHFIFQGDGAEKKKLMEQADEMKLDNITFLPFVSKNEISRYISILDVALVNLKKNDTFKTVIPSKIFENACMQKPILLGVEGESKEIIEKYNAGICFEPENKIEFLHSLHAISNIENYIQYKQGCLNLANDYNRISLANEMLYIINSSIN